MSAGEQLPPVAPSDGGSAGGSSIDELQVRLTSLGGGLWLQCFTKPLGELTGQFRHLPSVILYLFRNPLSYHLQAEIEQLKQKIADERKKLCDKTADIVAESIDSIVGLNIKVKHDPI